MCSLTSPRLVRNENVIDEEATFKKFGYYASDLKPKSGKKVVAACDDCGKVRISPKSHYHALCNSCSKKGKKFSEETRKKLSDARKGKNNANWKGGPVTQICEICGTEFPVQLSEIKKGKGRFCSPKCHGKWQSEHWRGEKVMRICKECGIEFPVKPSDIKRGGGKFCSPKCQHKYQRGKNHPGWKNGASFEPYCLKFNDEFKEYIRDKFGRVCFLCPKTEEENGQRLSVHHVNYNKSCGCDDDETCQFVPLCRSCNSKVNKNRKMWEAKIKAKMQNKLNGWYI